MTLGRILGIAIAVAAMGRADFLPPAAGLARALFYAGSRALLVSHWAGLSDATVKLTRGC